MKSDLEIAYENEMQQITEIAEKSGFNNQISFINAFKNLYKLTPTEFRNKTL